MTAAPRRRQPQSARSAARSAARGTAPAAGGGADRRAAAWLLQAVLEQGRSFDQAWAEAGSGDGCLAGLEDRDRAFARALCMTVLRRLRQLDRLVDARLERPLLPGRKSDPARAALRLGAAQILFMDVPDHAAVNASVALLPAESPFRGLVNAVLRRLAAGPKPDPADGAENLPGWLWQDWLESYGEPMAAALADAGLREAPLDLSVAADAALWAERLEAERLPTGGLRRPAGGRVEALPGFAEGAWWVQDAAASLPALALERAAGGLRGRAVLDLCAAPGGKTAQLVAMGAQVTAVERDPQRAARLASNLARLRLEARLVTADAALWRGGPPEGFDAVLLDAPCSATGTLRRHPDILHLRRTSDIPVAAALQDRLIDAALARLRPGGVMAYCVCSLQRAEGEERLAAALARHGTGLALLPQDPAALGLPQAAAWEGALRTGPHLWPERGGMDGFFIAVLRREG